MKRSLPLALVVFSAFPCVAASAPSQASLSIQGVLRDNGGSLQSMAVGLVVGLYPASDATRPFYTQSFITVPVENGFFSVELAGAGLAFSSPDAWAGVQVAGDPVELPRQHVTAVPYAFSAGNAAQLGGVAPEGYQRALLAPDCGVGRYIQKIDAAGNVTCGATLNTVNASGGITGSINGGTLTIGRDFSFYSNTNSNSATASFFAEATCGGDTLVAGGCSVGDINNVVISESYPSGFNRWHCTFKDLATTTQTGTAYAWCLRN